MHTKAYNQTATYWGSPVPNGAGGYTFSAARQILVRWEQRVEDYADDMGQIKASQAVVYALEDLDVNGYLMLGSSNASDPSTLPEAFEIKQMIRIPDIRGARYERRAFL